MRLSKEVAKLIEYHNSIMNISYARCKGCEVCNLIQEMRANNDKDPAEQYKDILAKGKSMTFNDVVFLYEKGVIQTVIRKAAGLQNEDISEVLENANIPMLTYEEYRKAKPKRSKFHLTKEEYKEMRSKGMNKTQIAATAGVSRGTLTYHIRKWDACDNNKTASHCL